MHLSPWYAPLNVDAIPSPALLVNADLVTQNIDHMVAAVEGQVQRLRPHVKTHKMPAIVAMQLAASINKFKTSTIAESEMTAQAGGSDILLAHQPVGPTINRLRRLTQAFPSVRFATIVDNLPTIRQLSDHWRENPTPLDLYIDIDVGMHRTGIAPGAQARELANNIADSPGVSLAGLHVYDGHLRATEAEARSQDFIAAFAPVHRVLADLEADGHRAPAVVGGGSPTFLLHAHRQSWECSPGTTLLWDVGYGRRFPDLPFNVAAVLLSRVISRPSATHACLDLGHKAIAAENPLDTRVMLPDYPNARFVMHSEEHLVIEASEGSLPSLGKAVYALPLHICPTVALHSEVYVVRNGEVTGETWPVTARARKLSI